MSHEDQVRAALTALADHDRHRESRLPAPRMRPRRQGLRWKTATAYAAALAAAAGLIVMLQPASQPVQPPIPIAELAPAVAQTVPTRKSEPPRRVATNRPPPAEVAREDDSEIATEFFPLTEVPLPFEHGQLVRVVVPAVTMQRVGLPVRPERWSDGVTADLLVGDEGMARAIRFVSFQQ